MRRLNGGCVAGIIGKQGDMFAKSVMPYALATADASAGGITSDRVSNEYCATEPCGGGGSEFISRQKIPWP